MKALVGGRTAYVLRDYAGHDSSHLGGVVVRYSDGRTEHVDYGDGRLVIDPTDAQLGILTLAEAARYLRLAPATLRRQVNNGRLDAKLVGKTYVVMRSEVERYRAESLGKPGRRAK